MNLGSIVSVLAAAAPNAPMQQNPIAQMLNLAAMVFFFVVVFYMFVIRPQQKRAREQADLLKALRPGDKIVTSGGLIGVVVGLKEKSVSIRSADTKLEVLKSAVAEITERAAAAPEA